jgi:flagellar protein FliO/FliZ
MNSLFGVELPTAVNFVIAFVVVLVLIGAAAWLVRRFGATRLDAAARGRQPRLAVIDSAAVDSRRKLVIIRRDNVEHLLMIGGATDVVVETNIVRAAVARDTVVPRNGHAEPGPRMLPDATTWPLQPEPMPAPAHAVRAERGPREVALEPPHWQEPVAPAPVPPLRAVRPADTLAGLASEIARPMSEPVTPPSRPIPVELAQAAPPVQPAATAIQSPAAQVDQSLAEMAQRLEAALRRPATPKPAATPGEARPARPEPRVAAAAVPKSAPKPQPQPPPLPDSAAQTSLEKEMASLLGRPGKT